MKPRRPRRLLDLYKLRARIQAEIDSLETTAERERFAAAARVARAEATRPAARPKVAACGTESGYYRHRRKLKDQACPACLLAHRFAEQDRAERRKAS